MAINRVAISGNLTRDAELRANTHSPVLSFSVAVNERRQDPATKEWKDYPSYIDCVLFGERALKIAEYLRKGLKVAVDGKLHQNRWQDKEGNSRSKVEVYVDQIEFMSQGRAQASVNQAQQEQVAFDAYDEDIPF